MTPERESTLLGALAGYDSRRDLKGRWYVHCHRGRCRLHAVPAHAGSAAWRGGDVETVFNFYGRTVDRIPVNATCEREEP